MQHSTLLSVPEWQKILTRLPKTIGKHLTVLSFWTYLVIIFLGGWLLTISLTHGLIVCAAILGTLALHRVFFVAKAHESMLLLAISLIPLVRMVLATVSVYCSSFGFRTNYSSINTGGLLGCDRINRVDEWSSGNRFCPKRK